MGSAWRHEYDVFCADEGGHGLQGEGAPRIPAEVPVRLR